MAFCKYGSEFIANNKTEIDNIFINDYLPFAPEMCVKVYLYGLYLCASGETIDNNLSSFAKHLNMSEDDVETSFYYWQEQGLVQVLSTRPIEIRYIPLKNIFNNTKLFKTDKYESFNRTAQELFEGKREITKTEYAEYYDFLERYHMEQEALIMIMKYCIDSKKSAVGWNYILTVAKNWANEGILTATQTEEKLCSFEEKEAEIGQVLKALSLHRASFLEERALYKKWTDEWDFTLNVILYVAKNLKKLSKANFEKIDQTLGKYYDLKLFTIADIESYLNNKGEIMTLAKNVNKAIGVYYENLETVAENYIIPWLNLGFDSETLQEIAKVCFKTSVRTLEGMNSFIQKLFKLGIVTSESLNRYINGVIETDKEVKAVLEKLGVVRNVNYLDRDNYKTWKNNWKISDELITYGCSLAKEKSAPMQYLNRVLSSWHDNNISTIDAAQKFSLPSTAQKTEPLKGRSYSRDELNALIQSVDEVEI